MFFHWNSAENPILGMALAVCIIVYIVSPNSIKQITPIHYEAHCTSITLVTELAIIHTPLIITYNIHDFMIGYAVGLL